MANVDFTLEDIQTIILKDVQAIVSSTEERLMRHMNTRFDEARDATIDLVGTVLDQLDEHNERFDRMDDRFDRMDDRFDSLESECKITNRLVRKHSQDIMELRSAD